jgi:hypothetical protein
MLPSVSSHLQLLSTSEPPAKVGESLPICENAILSRMALNDQQH